MKLLICSVGKAHEPYVKMGIEDFSKRIQHYYPLQWQIIASPKQAQQLPEAELKKAEASLILQQIQKDDYLVLLDERGKQLSSPELAGFLEKRALESNKRVVFLIGGAFGVADTITQRANFSWSLSKLVLPHMLVRLVLAEQIYRACTIQRNEKYHHQ